MAEIMAYPLNLEEYISAETVMLWHYGRTSGVFGADNNLAVAATNNGMDITVSDGTAWLTDGGEHSVVFHNSTESSTGNKEKLTVSIADGTLNRIDRVIIKWYLPQFSTKPTLEILKGTPASKAIAPSLTNNDTYREISLAQISIPAGITKITAANITDERLNPNVCGIVTSDVEIPTQSIQNKATAILNDLDITVDTTVAEITADAEDLINQIETDLEQVLAGGIPDNIVTTPKIANDAVTEDKINGLTTTITKLNYTSNVTSDIQTQLNGKQASITGGASTITSSNLTTNRALVSNSNGKVAVSAITSTELGYLDGVTSNIQTQFSNKANASHTHSASNITSGTLPIARGGTGASTSSSAADTLLFVPRESTSVVCSVYASGTSIVSVTDGWATLIQNLSAGSRWTANVTTWDGDSTKHNHYVVATVAYGGSLWVKFESSFNGNIRLNYIVFQVT